MFKKHSKNKNHWHLKSMSEVMLAAVITVFTLYGLWTFQMVSVFAIA